jgi:hypothetical protein
VVRQPLGNAIGRRGDPGRHDHAHSEWPLILEPTPGAFARRWPWEPLLSSVLVGLWYGELAGPRVPR